MYRKFSCPGSIISVPKGPHDIKFSYPGFCCEMIDQVYADLSHGTVKVLNLSCIHLHFFHFCYSKLFIYVS